MSLRERFQSDLKDAMKRGETLRVSTIRLLNAALHNREIAKQGALDEAEILEVLAFATKQRREAIAFAQQYGREDIAQQEARELAVLEAYLPEQLGTEALLQRIDAVVQELGATSPKDHGRVMKALLPTLKGRADGQTVNRLVREHLASLVS